MGCAALPSSSDPGRPTGVEPLLSGPLPDPHVFHDGDQYYIFGTGTHFYHGAALEPEAMVRDELELDFREEGGPYQIWAFKPYVHSDGSHHAYVTIHYGFFVTAVAHFVPQDGETWEPGHPVRRWRLNRVLVGDRSGEGPMAYDPKALRDDHGRLYLFYAYSKQRHSDVQLYAQAMIDPGTPDTAAAPRLVLAPEGYRSEDRNPGFIQLVEAANIVRWDDTYLLLYSVGDFALREGEPSNYKIGLAYSDQLIPPSGQTYRKILLPDPENLWDNDSRDDEVGYLLQSQHATWPNYCRDWVQGPGVGNIVRLDDGPWLVFHGYRPDAEHAGADQRYVWKAPLDIAIDRDRAPQDWVRVRLPEASPSP